MKTSDARIRYAVVGAGNLTQVAILPAFAHARENSELAALITDDPVKQSTLAKKYRIAHVGGYDDMERIFQEAKIDAAYIVTPNSLHREHTERAVRAGVHVLCEKPMAPTVADCEAMDRAAKDAGVKLMLAYRLHFEQGNLTAIERAQDGSLGKVKIFSSVFTQQVRANDIRTRSELGGGSVLDLGVYPINAARYLFRSEPIEVLAIAPPSLDPRFAGVDETVTAILRFPRGEIAQFTVSQGAASVSSYRLVGTEGDLRVEPAYDYVEDIRHYLTRDGRTEVTTFKRRDQFAAELIYFSRCILEHLEPEPSAEEGRCDLRVVEAIFESMRTGKSVSLPHFERTMRPDLSQSIRKPPVERVEPINAPAPAK